MYQYRISKRLLYRLSLQVVSSIWYHYSQCSEIISFFFFYRPLIYHQPVDYHLLYAESFDIFSSHSSPSASRTYSVKSIFSSLCWLSSVVRRWLLIKRMNAKLLNGVVVCTNNYSFCMSLLKETEYCK